MMAKRCRIRSSLSGEIPFMAGASRAYPEKWRVDTIPLGGGIHDVKERGNSRRIYPASGSGYAGAPGIFPFLAKGRDAGGAASRNKPILRSAKGAKACASHAVAATV